MIAASAPGKLILIGEYAVLEGGKALVAAVNRLAKVQLRPEASQFFVSAPELQLENIPFSITQNREIHFPATIEARVQNQLRFFSAAVAQVMQSIPEFSWGHSPFHILLDTAAFFHQPGNQKLGLGSSAALTVATVAALLKFAGQKIDSDERRQRIFEWSFAAHRRAQQNGGSGIDIAASTFGGVLEYQLTGEAPAFTSHIQRTRTQPFCHLIVIWSGFPTSTTEMIHKFAEFKQKHPSRFRSILQEMITTAEAAIAAWNSADAGAFFKAIETYEKWMDTLGQSCRIPIVSETHGRIKEIVAKAGGVYKPSGAGGGDLGIAFFPLEKNKQKIVLNLVNQGLSVVDLDVENLGVR